MKINMKRILTILTFLVFSFLPTAVSAADIDVTFVPDPLFNETEYLPGNTSIDRYAEVLNTSGEAQTIWMGLTNTAVTRNLAETLTLTVFENRSEVWSGTLAELVIAGQVPLSDLGNNADTRYDFFASMDSNSGNEYQSGRVEFDLWLGFDQEEDEEEPTSSGGGGGGGGFLPTTLQILDEKVSAIAPVGAGFDVTITWLTNLPANTRVVYGIDTGASYSLNLFGTNLGYPEGTSIINNATPVTEHQVLLPGLLPGTYRYRAVSSDGNITTSQEHIFILSPSGQIETVLGAFTGLNTETGTTFTPPAGQVLGVANAQQVAEVSTEEVPEAIQEQVEEFLPSVSVQNKAPKTDHCWRLFWFVTLVSLVLTLVWDMLIRDKGAAPNSVIWRGRMAMMAALLVLGVITLSFMQETCPIPQLSLLALIFAVLRLVMKRK